MSHPASGLSIAHYFIAGFSGLGLALAFPDFGIWPMAWFTMAPFLALLWGREPRQGARLGFVFGYCYFGPTLTWLANTMLNFGHMPLWLTIIVTGLGVMYMAFFTAFFGWLVCWAGRRAGEEMAMGFAPFFWVAVEMMRMYLPPLAFPWARIADSQYLFLPFIQMADLAGGEGAGFVIVFTNAALAMALRWRSGAEPHFPRRWAILSALMLTAVFAYGIIRMGQYGGGAGETIPVSLLQGDIDQARKWEAEYRREQTLLYVSMTREAASRGAKLVVWPETAAPFAFGQDPYFDNILRTAAREADVYILFGAPDWETKNGREVSYNRAWLLAPDGSAEKYDKVRLAPFGEYVPLPRLLFFVHRIAHAIGDLTPGQAPHTLGTPRYKLGPQICFEIIFPQYSAQLAAMGAGAIVTITNDSWFGRSAASTQSLSMAVFRAVESRIPVLRAAQSGVTAIVNPDGRIMGRTPLMVKTALDGSFVPRQGPPTWYSVGYWLVEGLFVFTALGMIAWAGYIGKRRGVK